jgi:hypothetical protein
MTDINDPIRLYKKNDPYYHEVDNLPLKDLQENDATLFEGFKEIDSILDPDGDAASKQWVDSTEGAFARRLSDLSDVENAFPVKNNLILQRATTLDFWEASELQVSSMGNVDFSIPVLGSTVTYNEDLSKWQIGQGAYKLSSFPDTNTNILGEGSILFLTSQTEWVSSDSAPERNQILSMKDSTWQSVPQEEAFKNVCQLVAIATPGVETFSLDPGHYWVLADQNDGRCGNYEITCFAYDRANNATLHLDVGNLILATGVDYGTQDPHEEGSAMSWTNSHPTGTGISQANQQIQKWLSYFFTVPAGEPRSVEIRGRAEGDWAWSDPELGQAGRTSFSLPGDFVEGTTGFGMTLGLVWKISELA